MKDIHLNDIDVVNLCLIQTTRCQGDEESVVELVRRTREGEGRVCAAVWGTLAWTLKIRTAPTSSSSLHHVLPLSRLCTASQTYLIKPRLDDQKVML